MEGRGDRRDRLNQSHLEVDCLHDPTIRTRFKVFRDLIASCRGPQGKAKVIQNSKGGHVTWTKISSRLFSTMSVSTPVLKLITSSVQAHIERFQDGGLLTAEFCLSLIDGSLDLDLHKRLVIELYEEFVMIIDNYLNECTCKFKIDVFDLNMVMRVLRSICEPKLSHLSRAAQRKICLLFLDVFLSTLPLEKQDFFSDKIFIQCFENSDVSDSTCIKGLLIECPELSSMEEKDFQKFQNIKVALVNESMSGDSNSFVDAVYESDGQMDSSAVVVKKLLEFCENLIEADVKLLLCQRVIHPKVKAMLRRADVMFVDRLGSQVIPYIRDLTGARPISILATCRQNDWDGFGQLDGIFHQIWSGKSYLLMRRQDQPIVTLVLRSNIEETLQELKVLSQSAVTSLNLLLREPWVLPGGGCWMSHLAAHLAQQVDVNMTRLVNDLDCSKAQVTQAVEMFTRCLMSLATCTTSGMAHITDSTHHHIWKSGHMTDGLKSCVCGLVSSDSVEKFEYITEKTPQSSTNDELQGFPQIVDSLCVVRNSLKMAVATANTVLSICQFIHDPV